MTVLSTNASLASPGVKPIAFHGVLARLVTILFVSVCVLIFSLCLYGMWVFPRLELGQVSDASIQRFVSASVTIPNIYLAITVLAFIVNGFWLHRASSNAGAVDAYSERISAGGAIGWYFVPIANFWKPFSSMRQTWNSTFHPRGDDTARSPGFIKAWWTLWIFGQIFGRGGERLSEDPSILYFMVVVSSGALAIAAVIFYRIIRDVTHEQSDPNFGSRIGQIFE